MNYQTRPTVRGSSRFHHYSHPPRAARRLTPADRLHVTLVAGYIAFAGIYWLPGVSHVLISQAKVALFAILVGIGFLRLKLYTTMQRNIFLLLGIGSLSSWLANYASTDMETAISQARNFIEPLLWLIALFGIRSCAYQLLFSRLMIGLAVFFLISLYPVGVYVGLVPNYYAPDVFTDATGMNLDKEWVLESASIIGGGFNGGRTGWGVTVSTTSLLALALLFRGTGAATTQYVIAALILVGSMASIFVTGARGGTFALLATVAYGVILARGYQISKIYLLWFVLFLLLSMDVTAALPEKFTRNFDASGDLFSRINSMTTGRFESYAGALKHFAESPLIGKGPEDAKVWVNNAQWVSVHNLWLRQLAESGLLVVAPLLLLTSRFVSIVLAGGNMSKASPVSRGQDWPNGSLVILCGLIMALAEPSVIIGSFNANAAFWTAVWMVMREPNMAGRPVVPG